MMVTSRGKAISLRQFIDVINVASLAACVLASAWLLDPLAIIGALILFRANVDKRHPALYYLMLMFNLHFTLRYVELKLFGFDDIFGQGNPELLGGYFLLASAMYFAIALALNLSARARLSQSDVSNKNVGRLGAASIVLFSAMSLTGQYSIGREIENAVARLLVRISLFFQYWMPALFFLKSWPVFAALYVVAMLVFGSKAFVYSLVTMALIYGLINNKKINYFIVLVIFVLGVVSILMFDAILAYRVTHELDFSSVLTFNSAGAPLTETVMGYLNRIGIRWAGLDTLAAYGEIDFRYSLTNIYYEIVTALNNLLPVYKIPMPDQYITSELNTAYLFRGYDFYSIAAGGLHHTDSMFGLSRFVAVNFFVGLALFAMCLAFPFVFRFRDYFVDSLIKIYFFTSILIGGSYSETFRLLFEFIIIFFIIRSGILEIRFPRLFRKPN